MVQSGKHHPCCTKIGKNIALQLKGLASSQANVFFSGEWVMEGWKGAEWLSHNNEERRGGTRGKSKKELKDVWTGMKGTKRGGKRKKESQKDRRWQQTETGLSLCMWLMWTGCECQLTHRHSISSAGWHWNNAVTFNHRCCCQRTGARTRTHAHTHTRTYIYV